jgi:hypothetical protein
VGISGVTLKDGMPDLWCCGQVTVFDKDEDFFLKKKSLSPPSFSSSIFDQDEDSL